MRARQRLLLQPPRRTTAGSGNANGLLTDLVDFWALNGDADEVGLHNALTFTQAGTPGSAAGIVYTTARAYDGPGTSDQHVRDNDDVRFGDEDFTIALWWYQNATPDGSWPQMYHYLLQQEGWEGGYTIGLNGGDELFFQSGRGDGVTDTLHSSVLATPNGAWHLGICWYTAADNTLHLTVDNGDEASTSGGARAAGTNPVRIGGDSGTDNTLDGRIGPLMMWAGVLTADQRAALWAAGAGLPYTGFTT